MVARLTEWASSCEERDELEREEEERQGREGERLVRQSSVGVVMVGEAR